jgi:polar amino acid transport system permease protein
VAEGVGSAWSRFLATFFDPAVAARYLPDILAGVAVTLGAGFAVVVTGLTLGLALAVLRTIGGRPVAWPVLVFVDVVRALPPFVLLLIVFFGLPNAGIVLPAFVVLWLVLSIVLAAFSEEVFWAGITSVAEGQWLAARATGLSRVQALRYVVLPQAVRLAVPPLTNRVVSITKNVALGSAIGVSEILGRASSAQAFSGNATPLTIGALLYLAIFIPLVVLARRLERRFGWKRI